MPLSPDQLQRGLQECVRLLPATLLAYHEKDIQGWLNSPSLLQNYAPLVAAVIDRTSLPQTSNPSLVNNEPVWLALIGVYLLTTCKKSVAEVEQFLEHLRYLHGINDYKMRATKNLLNRFIELNRRSR